MSEAENRIVETAATPPADAAPAPPPVNPAAPPPPPPAPRREEGPQMSTPDTLSGIFFEPGSTFEALRARPRVLVAALVMTFFTLLYTIMLMQKVPYGEMVRESVMNSPATAEMSQEQKEQAIQMRSKPFFKALNYATPLIGMAIYVALGGALYLLGSMAVGKGIGYRQAASVWTYSSLPPLVLAMIANLVILFVRPPDASQGEQAMRGLVKANPSVLVDGAAHPVLATALGSLDLFAIIGLVLATIGLRKVGRMSSGSAWAVVLSFYLLGLVFKLGAAALLKTPMA